VSVVSRDELLLVAPAFLQEREAKIRTGTATWDDFHQAGVAWSELAESAWWIQMEGWQRAVHRFGQLGMKRFDQALERVHGGDMVAICAIHADIAMLRARQGRFNDDKPVWEAIERLDWVITTLKGMIDTPADNVRGSAVHKLAIAYGFLSRLYWGYCLGFCKDVVEESAVWASEQATHYFDREALNPPDAERAYRTHLLMQALAEDRKGNAFNRRQFARLAGRSARRYGDRRHTYRACAIYLLGSRGEGLLRKQRDSRVIDAAL
jgi:hypothetical protein